jgi:hypothetical protein
VDSELDGLYGADLDEFVSRRNDLAKRLSAAGDRDQADAVRQRRKPTIVAWTANQLARVEREQVDRLLALGDALRRANRAALEGDDPRVLREAQAAHRDAIRALGQAGREILEERRGTATDTVVERLSATLRAASVDDERRELLARGQLDEDVEPAGFEALGSLANALAASKAGRERRQAKRQPAPRRAEDQRGRRQELYDAVTQARQRERELRAQADAAERQAARLRHEADKAGREAEQAERDAEDARRSADAAAATLTEAEDRLAESQPRRRS